MYESDNRKSYWYPDFASDLKEQIQNSNGFTHNCTSLQIPSRNENYCLNNDVLFSRFSSKWQNWPPLKLLNKLKRKELFFTAVDVQQLERNKRFKRQSLRRKKICEREEAKGKRHYSLTDLIFSSDLEGSSISLRDIDNIESLKERATSSLFQCLDGHKPFKRSSERGASLQVLM